MTVVPGRDDAGLTVLAALRLYDAVVRTRDGTIRRVLESVIALGLAGFITGCAPQGTALFNGESLDGWHATGGGTWLVQDGVIVGFSSRDVSAHGLLVSDAAYTDFTVTFEYRVHTGDSGFYFRAEETGTAVGVKGFQVEVDDVEPGGLYETAGRGWVIKHTPEKAATWHRSKAWNRVVLKAEGPRVVVHVNGVETASLDDPRGRRSGHFALQLHGGQDMHVEYRDIRLVAP